MFQQIAELFPWVFGFIILILLVIILFPQKPYTYQPRRFLLTQAEMRLYKILRTVLPPATTIAPKVRLGDIVTCPDKDWAKHGPLISAKHIDFVLYDSETTAILLCIELDDQSHNRPDRRRRDQFVNAALGAAKVPILRIPAAGYYDREQLKKTIHTFLENNTKETENAA